MVKDYSKFTHDELIKYIEELQSQLQQEKYGLFWDKSIEIENEIRFLLQYIPVLSRKTEPDFINNLNNILIEGDNICSLTALNYLQSETIDVIYIDPPYNTGNQDFVYNDDFVDDEDGYRHSKWLSFMEKRLILAKSLLKNSGVIFISINDIEQANLKLLCDKIFGSKNFIANLVWSNNEGGGSSDSKFFKVKHEYVLCYAKKILETNLIKNVDIEDQDRYKLSDQFVATRGKYQLVKLSSASIQYSKSLDYPIECPDGTFVYPADNSDKSRSSWRWGKEKLTWGIENGFIEFKKDKNGVWQVYTKQYLNCDKDGNLIARTKKPIGIIEKYSSTQGSNLLFKILNTKKFSYPKPVELIKYLLDRFSQKDSIILDFFAGSGTTGQAVLELNKEDGGNRRFILCTNNENNICTDVTYPRLKTVITGIRPDGTKYSDGIPANLIYYKTDFIKDSNNTDQAKYCLVEKVDELLCISEDIFIQLERNDYSSHYVSNDESRHMFIYSDYYNETKFKEFKQRVLSTSGTKVVYIFSSDNNIDETLFEGIRDVEVKPIPSKIYEIYKEIVEDIKRG